MIRVPFDVFAPFPSSVFIGIEWCLDERVKFNKGVKAIGREEFMFSYVFWFEGGKPKGEPQKFPSVADAEAEVWCRFPDGVSIGVPEKMTLHAHHEVQLPNMRKIKIARRGPIPVAAILIHEDDCI